MENLAKRGLASGSRSKKNSFTVKCADSKRLPSADLRMKLPQCRSIVEGLTILRALIFSLPSSTETASHSAGMSRGYLANRIHFSVLSTIACVDGGSLSILSSIRS